MRFSVVGSRRVGAGTYVQIRLSSLRFLRVELDGITTAVRFGPARLSNPDSVIATPPATRRPWPARASAGRAKLSRAAADGCLSRVAILRVVYLS